MDSGYIPYALEKGVMISINPDAHSRESMHNVRFGVDAARRGGLPVKACLTAKNLREFAAWIAAKR
jgi:DNA polymerase (family 10)